MEGWQKMLLAAGGAAAVGAALYYLLREDAETEAAIMKQMGGSDVSKETIIEVLTEIVEAKKATSNNLGELGSKLGNKLKDTEGSMPALDEVYKMVKDSDASGTGNIQDVLKNRGLSTMDLDMGMMKFQGDPDVMSFIPILMGGAVPPSAGADKKEPMSVERIVEVYQTMVAAAGRFVAEFEDAADKTKYDVQVLMMAAETAMHAQVKYKLGVDKSDLELSVQAQEAELPKSAAFMMTQKQLQEKMEPLLKHFGASMTG